MTARLLLTDSPGERRAALVDADGHLRDVVEDRDHAPPLLGGVFAGRVVRTHSAAGGAFVEIGAATPAYLPARRALPAEGAAVVVQVTAEPHAEKAATVTDRPALTGGRLVYTPGRSGATVSRRVAGDTDRRALQSTLARLLADGEGAVARRPALGADPESLAAELDALRAAWRRVEAADRTPPARLLAPPPAAVRALADHAAPEPKEILAESHTLARRAAAWCATHRPDLADRVTVWRETEDLPAAHGVEAALAEALDAVVPLPCGGRLVVEPTRALVAVDVDGGGAGARRANEEAAAALPAALRLRALGGQVVVDFLRGGRRQPLKDRVVDGAAEDPGDLKVHGFGPLGLLEMERQRRQAPLADRYGTPEAEGLAALRHLMAATRADPAAPLRVTVPPAVARALEGSLAEAVAEAGRRLGGTVTVEAAGSQ